MAFAQVTERKIKEFMIDGEVVTVEEFVSQIKKRNKVLLLDFDGHPEVAALMSPHERWAII